jgi:hypothetical protein
MTGPKPLPRRLLHERPSTAERSDQRQHALYAAVTARASNVSEQIMLLRVEAQRTGASEADIRRVQEKLLDQSGYVKECDSDWPRG